MEPSDFDKAFEAERAALPPGWQAGLTGAGGLVLTLLVRDTEEGSTYRAGFPRENLWDTVERLRMLVSTKQPRLSAAMVASGLAQKA